MGFSMWTATDTVKNVINIYNIFDLNKPSNFRVLFHHIFFSTCSIYLVYIVYVKSLDWYIFLKDNKLNKCINLSLCLCIDRHVQYLLQGQRFSIWQRIRDVIKREYVRGCSLLWITVDRIAGAAWLKIDKETFMRCDLPSPF